MSFTHIGFDDEERNLAHVENMKSSKGQFSQTVFKPAFFEVFKVRVLLKASWKKTSGMKKFLLYTLQYASLFDKFLAINILVSRSTRGL